MDESANEADLNEVEADVLVERVKDQFRQAVVAPRTVNQKQLTQISELKSIKKSKISKESENLIVNQSNHQKPNQSTKQ